jgi:hypothetical protein
MWHRNFVRKSTASTNFFFSRYWKLLHHQYSAVLATSCAFFRHFWILFWFCTGILRGKPFARYTLYWVTKSKNTRLPTNSLLIVPVLIETKKLYTNKKNVKVYRETIKEEGFSVWGSSREEDTPQCLHITFRITFWVLDEAKRQPSLYSKEKFWEVEKRRHEKANAVRKNGLSPSLLSTLCLSFPFVLNAKSSCFPTSHTKITDWFAVEDFILLLFVNETGFEGDMSCSKERFLCKRREHFETRSLWAHAIFWRHVCKLPLRL